MGTLDNRVAIVTGAGQGIGQGIALALATEGAAFTVAELDGERALTTAAAIEELGGVCLHVACDVRSTSDIDACVQATVARFAGRLLHYGFHPHGQRGTGLSRITVGCGVRTGAKSATARQSRRSSRTDRVTISASSRTEAIAGERDLTNASQPPAHGAVTCRTQLNHSLASNSLERMITTSSACSERLVRDRSTAGPKCAVSEIREQYGAKTLSAVLT